MNKCQETAAKELEKFLRKNILAVYFFAKLGYTF